MTAQEYRDWIDLYENVIDEYTGDPEAWREIIWQHLEAANYVPDLQQPDYSDSIVWAAFWISLGGVLAAWLLSGRAM